MTNATQQTTSPKAPTARDLDRAITMVATQIGAGILTSSDLKQVMQQIYGGSDAAGHWSWRMAYDVMQAGAIRAVSGHTGRSAPFEAVQRVAASLLTETRRSEAQIRLQQFSTPLPYAWLVARAANIQQGELVLEPSAGTGNIASMAKASGAKLILNEIDPFRAQLLSILFGGNVHQLDGEHIDDLLGGGLQPSVIVMNPPFSSSVARSNDKEIAAKHLIAAAKRLATSGRLVAVMPARFGRDQSCAYWKRATSMLAPRLSVTIPSATYRKLGTSLDTQLMLFDKTNEAAGVECH